MANYTRTIIFDATTPRWGNPEGLEGKAYSDAYNKHYNENVKPVFDNTEKCVKQIESEQLPRLNLVSAPFGVFGVFSETPVQYILWNKCRYFELSVYDRDILLFVSRSAKVKIQYNNMLIGGSDKLEAVVRAFNKKGIYCDIEQNWI